MEAWHQPIKSFFSNDEKFRVGTVGDRDMPLSAIVLRLYGRGFLAGPTRALDNIYPKSAIVCRVSVGVCVCVCE